LISQSQNNLGLLLRQLLANEKSRPQAALLGKRHSD